MYDHLLYVLGGALGGDVRDVSFTEIMNDGTLKPWQSTTALPEGRYGAFAYGVVTR